MILVWGIPDDGPTRAVIDALESMRAPLQLLDQHDVLNTPADVQLDGLDAAYLRPYDSRLLPAVASGSREEKAHAAAVERAVCGWSEVTSAFVVNRPSAMASNHSKPYQSQIIQHHFAVPETLITTDVDALDAFRETFGELIYKSSSGVRSIVTRLTDAHSPRLRNLASCPTQFQQWIDGTDVRVHVVGSEVFAAEIESTATDYRYPRGPQEAAEIRAIALPPDVADRCVRLAASLRLPLAGVDLRRSNDGEWYCFEVNPSPAFTYYEESTGQPIATAVASILVSGGY